MIQQYNNKTLAHVICIMTIPYDTLSNCGTNTSVLLLKSNFEYRIIFDIIFIAILLK